MNSSITIPSDTITQVIVPVGGNYLSGLTDIIEAARLLRDKESHYSIGNTVKGCLNVLSTLELAAFSFNPAVTNQLLLLTGLPIFAAAASLAGGAYALKSLKDAINHSIDLYNLAKRASFEGWLEDTLLQITHLEKLERAFADKCNASAQLNDIIEYKNQISELQGKISSLLDDVEARCRTYIFAKKPDNSNPSQDEKDERHKEILAIAEKLGISKNSELATWAHLQFNADDTLQPQPPGSREKALDQAIQNNWCMQEENRTFDFDAWLKHAFTEIAAWEKDIAAWKQNLTGANNNNEELLTKIETTTQLKQTTLAEIDACGRCHIFANNTNGSAPTDEQIKTRYDRIKRIAITHTNAVSFAVSARLQFGAIVDGKPQAPSLQQKNRDEAIQKDCTQAVKTKTLALVASILSFTGGGLMFASPFCPVLFIPGAICSVVGAVIGGTLTGKELVASASLGPKLSQNSNSFFAPSVKEKDRHEHYYHHATIMR